MQDKLYKALTSKYESQRDTALAELSVYFNSPVGVGEHPHVVEEMGKLLETLANAEDCLATLDRHGPSMYHGE